MPPHWSCKYTFDIRFPIPCVRPATTTDTTTTTTQPSLGLRWRCAHILGPVYCQAKWGNIIHGPMISRRTFDESIPGDTYPCCCKRTKGGAWYNDIRGTYSVVASYHWVRNRDACGWRSLGLVGVGAANVWWTDGWVWLKIESIELFILRCAWISGVVKRLQFTFYR